MRNSWMSVPGKVCLAIVVLCLAGCGGGGGDKVVVPANTPLHTSAPSVLTMTAGEGASYTVSGGGGKSNFTSYKASSGNPAVATVTVSGSSLNVKAVASGMTNITVTDETGTSIFFTVKVDGANASMLAINAPSPLTASPGTVLQFPVVGGKAPYSVASSNQSVVAALINGTTLSLTGIAAGSASVVVYDAAGANATIQVTTGAGNTSVNFFTTATSSLTFAQGERRSYQMGGGVAPYSAVSSNTAVATVTTSGNNVTLAAVQAGTATVDLVDSVGTRVSLALNVTGSGSSQMQTSAGQAVTIANGVASSYKISGGVGPYTVTSNTNSVAGATVNGSNFTILGLSVGSATLTVRDAAGASSQIAVTVGAGAGAAPLYTTANSSITLATGEVGSYFVRGGVPMYSATSSNTSVIKVELDGGELKVTGVASGSSVVSIHDAAGTALTITVTVP